MYSKAKNKEIKLAMKEKCVSVQAKGEADARPSQGSAGLPEAQIRHIEHSNSLRLNSMGIG
jgi:hypothetical protein